jgi:hypothetical protein
MSTTITAATTTTPAAPMAPMSEKPRRGLFAQSTARHTGPGAGATPTTAAVNGNPSIEIKGFMTGFSLLRWLRYVRSNTCHTSQTPPTRTPARGVHPFSPRGLPLDPAEISDCTASISSPWLRWERSGWGCTRRTRVCDPDSSGFAGLIVLSNSTVAQLSSVQHRRVDRVPRVRVPGEWLDESSVFPGLACPSLR